MDNCKTGFTDKPISLRGNPRLVAAPPSSIRIHKSAKPAFEMSQVLRYQADVKNLRPNFIGLPTFSIPYGIEKSVEGGSEFHIFAGWSAFQCQLGIIHRTPKSIPLMLFPVGGFNIEVEAFRYLHTQLSLTLSEDTFLVHAMDFAEICDCKDSIVSREILRFSKPHRFAEEYMRVGEKRASRQRKRHVSGLINSVRGVKQ